MKKKISLILGLAFISQTILYAQATISPAEKQSSPIAIIGATIHIGNGEVINNGFITFDKGKITSVGAGALPSTSGFNVIDATGKQLYPGFICPNTTLGLVEIESGARGTVDGGETGELNPEVRTLIAYNTDSKVIPTLRSNGILLAQPTPYGGLLSGQSSVVQLDAWNWEDAAYKTDIGIHINWPELWENNGSMSDDQRKDQTERVEKELQTIDKLFTEAKAYADIEKPLVVNVRLASMRGLFNKTKKVFFNVDGAEGILQCIAFAKKFDLTAVIVGGGESDRVAEALKESNTPVIITQTQRLPGHDGDDVYLPYKLPKILQDAGVLYGLTGYGYWRQRNLPFQAGQAVGYGLSKEQALSMITLNNAKILGIDQTTGTLTAGKDANLFISTGDALDMISIHLERAFIQGRDINLDNLHKQLYKKFSAKYGLKADL